MFFIYLEVCIVVRNKRKHLGTLAQSFELDTVLSQRALRKKSSSTTPNISLEVAVLTPNPSRDGDRSYDTTQGRPARISLKPQDISNTIF